MSLFDFGEESEMREAAEKEALEKEKNLQKAAILIKNKYGKNAVVKGMSFKEGATAIERNESVGGHRA